MLVSLVPNAHAHSRKPRLPPYRKGPWKTGRATFYGGADASGTKGGACGYEDPFALGYGEFTVAISSAMFKDGLTCGACYEVKCTNVTGGCKPGQSTVLVTATNHCPGGGWCAPPQEHFDLSEPAFVKIAERNAGVVPISHRRVPCRKPGGMKFSIQGNDFYNLVTITNVGGAGDIVGVEVKGTENLRWTKLKRNWGQKWQADVKLTGRKLTFRVMTSDGKTITSRNVFPKNWQFGKTYEGKSNFARKHVNRR